MILNAKGEPYRRLTLVDVAQEVEPSLIPVIEALSKTNFLLQEEPRQGSFRIVDQFGRPIWRDSEPRI